MEGHRGRSHKYSPKYGPRLCGNVGISEPAKARVSRLDPAGETPRSGGLQPPSENNGRFGNRPSLANAYGKLAKASGWAAAIVPQTKTAVTSRSLLRREGGDPPPPR